jgi:hypothetical protein
MEAVTLERVPLTPPRCPECRNMSCGGRCEAASPPPLRFRSQMQMRRSSPPLASTPARHSVSSRRRCFYWWVD